MSLGQKIGVCFAAIAAVGMALSYSSLRAIEKMGAMLDVATNVAARRMNLVTDIHAGFRELEGHAKRTQLAHAIRKLEGARVTGNSCGACHTPSSPEEDLATFETAAAQVQQRIGEAKELIAEPRSQAELEVLANGIVTWRSLYRDYLSRIGSNDFASAHDIIMSGMLPVLGNIDKASGQLIDEQRAVFRDANAQAHRTAHGNLWTAAVLIGLGALASVLVFSVLAGATTRLRHVTMDLSDRAEMLSQAATSVSSASVALAQGASEQAGAIEEMASSSAEISATAHQNAGHARNSADVSTQLSHSLGEAMERLEQFMAAMRSVEQSSSKVAKIIKVIDGVAFQTNILALNAAVEAARAGEAGLGFAVVAGEVRGLAQRSAEAAHETAALIEESILASQNSAAKLAEVTTAFQLLAQGADSMTHLAGSVQSGSLDQAHQVEAITEKIGRIRGSTQETASSAEESARTGEDLATQAENLRHAVSGLLAIAGGRRTG